MWIPEKYQRRAFLVHHELIAWWAGLELGSKSWARSCLSYKHVWVFLIGYTTLYVCYLCIWIRYMGGQRSLSPMQQEINLLVVRRIRVGPNYRGILSGKGTWVKIVDLLHSRWKLREVFRRIELTGTWTKSSHEVDWIKIGNLRKESYNFSRFHIVYRTFVPLFHSCRMIESIRTLPTSENWLIAQSFWWS